MMARVFSFILLAGIGILPFGGTTGISGRAFAADWSQEHCQTGPVCLVYELNGDVLDVLFRNTFPSGDIITTVTLEHKSAPGNLSNQSKLPVTVVCRGSTPVRATTFKVLDKKKPWHTNIKYYWKFGSADMKRNERHPYMLPYAKGMRFRIGQGFFGEKTHKGDHPHALDWLMPVGTPIHAARSGIVVEAVDTYSGAALTDAYKGRDNKVIILHEDGTAARYMHLNTRGVLVRVGQRVKTGELIAYSGNTGYSGSPHLHFDIIYPSSGKKETTIPFGFVTDYADYEVLESGGIYTFTGARKKKKRPLVEEADIRICRDFFDTNGLPGDARTVFSLKERFVVFVPVDSKGKHELEIRLCKGDNPVPVKTGRVTGQGKILNLHAPIDLSGVPDPTGQWRAEIFIDGQRIGARSFIVKK